MDPIMNNLPFMPVFAVVATMTERRTFFLRLRVMGSQPTIPTIVTISFICPNRGPIGLRLGGM